MSTYNLDVSYTIRDELGDSLPPLTVSSGSEAFEKIATTLTTTQTDKQIAMSFKYAKLKAFVVQSDKQITIETNATDHTGGDILTIYANEPFVWRYGSYGSNPFANDVTTAYLTNAASATATVKIWYVYDPT